MIFVLRSFVLLMFLSWTLPSEAVSCPYYYDIQPPNSSGCFPFGSYNLAIACRGCSTKTSAFSIIWNGNNSASNIEITTSDPVSDNATGEQAWCIESRLTFVGLFLSDYVTADQFCQIVSPDGESSFLPSNSVVLGSVLSGFEPCSGNTVFASNEFACAINQSIIPSTSTQTTIPSGTTTMTTTTTTTTTTSTFGAGNGGITVTVASQSISSFVSVSTTTSAAATTTTTPTAGHDGITVTVGHALAAVATVVGGIFMLMLSSTLMMMCCWCHGYRFCQRKDGVCDKPLESIHVDSGSSTSAKSMEEEWSLTQSSTKHSQEVSDKEEQCCERTPLRQPSEKSQQLDILRQEAPPQYTQKPYQPKLYTKNLYLQKPYQAQEQCLHLQKAFSQCPPQQEASEVIPEHLCMWDDEPYTPPSYGTYPNRKSLMKPYPCKESHDYDVLLQRRTSITEQLDEEFHKMTELVQQLETSLNSLNLSYEVINIVRQNGKPLKLATQCPRSLIQSPQEMQSSVPTTNVPLHECSSSYDHHVDHQMTTHSEGLSQTRVLDGRLPHNLVRRFSEPQLMVMDSSTIQASDAA